MTGPTRSICPLDLLADLDPAQREAVLATTGPVCILAGAGTGKTRAISRRVGLCGRDRGRGAQHVLVVTFTDKAAGEMRERLAALGRPGIVAATFHAAALRQLRHFWPRAPAPSCRGSWRRRSRSSCRSRSEPAGRLPLRRRARPGGRDRVGQGRRVRPRPTRQAVESDGHDGPLPGRLFAPLYRRYEARQGAGRPDRLRGHARARRSG